MSSSKFIITNFPVPFRPPIQLGHWLQPLSHVWPPLSSQEKGTKRGAAQSSALCGRILHHCCPSGTSQRGCSVAAVPLGWIPGYCAERSAARPEPSLPFVQLMAGNSSRAAGWAGGGERGGCVAGVGATGNGTLRACVGLISYVSLPFDDGVLPYTPNLTAWWVRQYPERMFHQLSEQSQAGQVDT